jgi:hypothetical protein
MARASDERFVGALLERLLGSAAQEDLARTERALAALAPARAVSRRRFAGLAAALVASAAGVLFFAGPAAPSAEAALERVLTTLAQPLDRRYSIAIEPAGRLGARLGGVHGELTVRGGERFAVHFSKGLREEHWAGYDGVEAWLVPGPERLPVLVARDPERLEQWMAERGADTPFLALAPLLERLRGYELTLERDGDVDVLSAHRRPGQRGPEQVSVRADASSGELLALTLQGDYVGASRVRRAAGQVDLKLLERVDLAPEFYGHSAHHAPERALRTF